MPKVSIIVPIYNSETHLSRCIDSILAQTYSDFELILVNDGSIDNSGKICEEYAQKDSRIIVIHKENGGTSSARNIGMEKSLGEYITFVDSDDTIYPNYLCTFSYNADLEVAGLETIGSNLEIDYPDSYNKLEKPSDIYKWFTHNSHRKYLTSICCKLFNRNIVISNALKFNCYVTYGEDTIFIYNYLSCCKNISLIQCVIYKYYVDSEQWANKYSLVAIDCINHILMITLSLNRIEKNYNFSLPSKLKTKHYATYLHLFYTYLKSANKIERITELKKFRKNSHKLQLWRALNFKDYIYWRIMPMYLMS